MSDALPRRGPALSAWRALPRARRRAPDATSDLELAHRIARAVGGLVDLDTVFRTAVDALQAHLGDDGVAILRCDHRRRRLELAASRGALRIADDYVQDMDTGLLGVAVRSGRPAITEDAATDARCVRAPGMEALRSELVMPLRTRDGSVRAVLDVTSPHRGRYGPAEVSLLGTVAAALEGSITAAGLYQDLDAQAARDPLTGLPNHRAFHERLAGEVARALRHGRSLSIALVDLDHFTLVNDAQGHHSGDQVLMEVAARLGALARAGDVVGRVGGEEFAFILPETDALTAYGVAERARAAIASAPFGEAGHLSASAGVCDLSHSTSAAELFRLADGALYWAKAHGRDVTYLYSPEVVRELSAQERAERLEHAQALAALRALARAVDAKDRSTREHSTRVAALSHALARQLGWSDDEARDLRRAALLHDVGKIGVPDAILLKPGALTDDEMARVRGHAALGAEIVGELLPPEQVAWVRHHHERWDGCGYPNGIAGTDIPEGARVIAVADAWDVMRSDRPYRAALDAEAAMEQMRTLAGVQFCPGCVDALFAVIAGLPAVEAGPVAEPAGAV
jgi:diguanylate cyclase (GGDEF)-like protein/putative nucleotidyltransferase with HDIG domain